MNSPYVETDEQQLQWLSNASFDNMLACAGIGSVAEFGLMGERRPRYRVNASLGDLGSYSVQEAQYQHQPAVAWNNIDPVESTGFQFGPGCFATAASLWAIPYPGFHPAVALSELYSHDDLPTQFYSVPELQATPGNSSGSIVQSDGITHLTSISPGSGPSSSRAEYMIPTKLMEVKRVDPPMLPSADGTMPRPQSPRFVGDEYAAPWVRGSGVERTGWCGFCPTWHRLKDSQYWYHMHYSHGISCVTGKPFKGPLGWRHQRPGATACEALCGGCNEWIYIGRPDRWRTPYYRHAYKCQIKKTLPSMNAGRSKSSSPRKTGTKPAARSESF